MAGTSQFERMQIESVFAPKLRDIKVGSGLYLMPDSDPDRQVFEIAVNPAMQKNEINVGTIIVAFDSDSFLSQVAQYIQVSEIVIAEVSEHNPHVLYVLGMCHGMGRCPLLVTRDASNLPFGLQCLRWVQYKNDQRGLVWLREELTRAIRVFLAAARAPRD